MLAYLMIRTEPHYRRDSFAEGLMRCGFNVTGTPRGPVGKNDVLVIWNRYGRFHSHALDFERQGARVIVAENGPLGRDWRGEHWYSIFEGRPAVGGPHSEGGPERWESFGVELAPWRTGGREIVVLGQRGIGPPGIAQPPGWHHQAARALSAWHPVRIREHPGERPCRALEADLEDAQAVVTWASGAAYKALLMGVPVFYGLPGWIGRHGGKWLNLETLNGPLDPQYPDRLRVFHSLGWVGWRTHEIATGEPFRRLLGSPSTSSASITEAR